MKKSDKQRLTQIASLGCLICGRPAELHHCREGVGMGQRGKEVIPLCPWHHRQGGWGRSIHGGYKEFCKQFGTESYFIKMRDSILGGKP